MDETRVMLDETMARIIATHRRKFSAGEFNCPHLVPPENACENGRHFHCVDQGEGEFLSPTRLRDCPLAVRKRKQETIADVMRECPYVGTIAQSYGIVEFSPDLPMWEQLLAKVDADRLVKATIGERSLPLRDLLRLIRSGCEKPDPAAHHTMFSGPCGTGKTTIQMVMFLAAHEAGLNPAWVDSIALRDLSKDLNSGYDPVKRKAQEDYALLVRRKVLFWNDVGDTKGSRTEFGETIAALLERSSGRLVTSSNLTPPELEHHPDVGKRAVSRMLASRNGKPAICVLLSGQDQRRQDKRQAALTEI